MEEAGLLRFRCRDGDGGHAGEGFDEPLEALGHVLKDPGRQKTLRALVLGDAGAANKNSPVRGSVSRHQ